MSDLPPIYVINLKRTPERKLHIQRELDALNLSYQFVEAIDKYDLYSPDYRRRIAQQLNIEECEIAAMCEKIRKGDIACALSHIKVYNLMIENNISVACVLEDDGHLLPTFPDMLAASKEVSWDVLMFSHGSDFVWQIITGFYRQSSSKRHLLFGGRPRHRWKRKTLHGLCKLILHKISHPQLNLHTIISALLDIRKSGVPKNIFQYYRCKLGALPSRDRSSWHKATSDHYIAKPATVEDNCPTCVNGYMVTRSAAIKWKHAIISRCIPVDTVIGYFYREENLDLHLVVPPCITANHNYLVYSSRAR